MSAAIELSERGARTVSPATLAAKRVLDLLLGIPLCFLVVPVVGVLALALAVRHRINPFFVHDRIGYRGTVIRIPKLRTLPPSTHPYADKTVATLEPPGRFARMLRRTHLDELPQLFLVPSGRLSLVGPRPRMLSEVQAFDDPDFDVISTSVPPGCTGLWQISVAQGGRVSDHPEYAYFYVEHRTLRLDLWILWRTFRQAIGASPITLHDTPRWALRPGVVLAREAAA